jgi:hypothetical protein
MSDSFVCPAADRDPAVVAACDVVLDAARVAARARATAMRTSCRCGM